MNNLLCNKPFVYSNNLIEYNVNKSTMAEAVEEKLNSNQKSDIGLNILGWDILKLKNEIPNCDLETTKTLNDEDLNLNPESIETTDIFEDDKTKNKKLEEEIQEKIKQYAISHNVEISDVDYIETSSGSFLMLKEKEKTINKTIYQQFNINPQDLDT